VGAAVALAVLVGAVLLLMRSSRTPETGQQGALSSTKASSKPPDQLTLDLGNGVKLELVRIKAGKFLMGSPDSDKDANANEKPQHEVTISKDFYLGKYSVTQEQYQHVMKGNPSWFAATYWGRDKVAGMDTRRFPVEHVSWENANRFCQKVSTFTKRRVELPTEAEWEYACRANTKTRYYCGDALTETDANFNSKLGRTTEVGMYPANQWGLYDMTGNVGQWCADCERMYTRDTCTDPRGPGNPNSVRVLRGGSSGYPPSDCRSAFRSWSAVPNVNTGFRVAVRLD
jgi:formylglycine-generating enzyme required for sulfatase activity